MQDLPGSRQIAARQRNHHPLLEDRDVGGRQSQRVVGDRLRLGILAEGHQRIAVPPGCVGRAGVEGRGSLEAGHGRLPPAERLLRDRGRGEQVHVVGRDAEPGLIRGERAGVVERNPAVVLAEGEIPLRPIRSEPARLLGGRQRPLADRRRRRGARVELREGLAEPGPRGDERGVERDRPLVEADGPTKARRVRCAHACRCRLSLEVGVVGSDVRGGPGGEPAAHAVGEGHAEGARHLAGDIRLHLEDVGERRVERLLPAAARGLAGRAPRPARGSPAPGWRRPRSSASAPSR